jgi:ribonuclease BN (tRNA processing enzyme)
MMRFTIGGVRGSCAVTGGFNGESFAHYGGDTSSLLVTSESGAALLFDLGTGARQLAKSLLAQGQRDLSILLTHFHLDHLAALAMLPPLYRGDCRLTFFAAERADHSLQAVLSRLLEPPYWPVPMDKMPSGPVFRTLPAPEDGPLRIADLEVRWCEVPHPGGCVAYRCDEPATGASLVFATDLEWPAATEAQRQAFFRLLREPAPAQALMMDGQYTREEYDQRRSWGHSPWESAVEVAQQAGVERLWIIHHDPERTDAQLDRLQAAASRRWAAARFARQGESVRLMGPDDQDDQGSRSRSLGANEFAPTSARADLPPRTTEDSGGNERISQNRAIHLAAKSVEK